MSSLALAGDLDVFANVPLPLQTVQTILGSMGFVSMPLLRQAWNDYIETSFDPESLERIKRTHYWVLQGREVDGSRTMELGKDSRGTAQPEVEATEAGADTGPRDAAAGAEAGADTGPRDAEAIETSLLEDARTEAVSEAAAGVAGQIQRQLLPKHQTCEFWHSLIYDGTYLRETSIPPRIRNALSPNVFTSESGKTLALIQGQLSALQRACMYWDAPDSFGLTKAAFCSDPGAANVAVVRWDAEDFMCVENSVACKWNEAHTALSILQVPSARDEHQPRISSGVHAICYVLQRLLDEHEGPVAPECVIRVRVPWDNAAALQWFTQYLGFSFNFEHGGTPVSALRALRAFRPSFDTASAPTAANGDITVRVPPPTMWRPLSEAGIPMIAFVDTVEQNMLRALNIAFERMRRQFIESLREGPGANASAAQEGGFGVRDTTAQTIKIAIAEAEEAEENGRIGGGRAAAPATVLTTWSYPVTDVLASLRGPGGEPSAASLGPPAPAPSSRTALE
jgi:hypothetical protein